LFEADMPTSVRLDIKTEQTLARLARKKGTSKSAVLREAVDCLARQTLHAQASGGLFARAEDLLGCVSGGAADLSTRTGAGFRRLLAQKGRSEKPRGLPD
jgi:predicted transcriptional regulator